MATYQAGFDHLGEGPDAERKVRRRKSAAEKMNPSKISGMLPKRVSPPVIIFKRISRWFVVASGTSLSGIVVGVLVAELEHIDDRNGETVLGLLVNFLKFCIVVISVISMYCFVEYYDGLVELAKARGTYIAKGASYFARLRRAGILNSFILDIVVQIAIPWPFLDLHFDVWDQVLKEYSRYSLSALLVLGMFSRFIYLPRLVCTFHHLNSEDARTYGRLIAVDVSTSMISKVLLNESFLFLAGLWFVCIFVFSYILFTFERDYALAHNIENETLQSFNNCIWLTAVTMTTIGYGDLYPATRFGRMCLVVSCFVAVALFALTLNLILAFLSIGRDEENFLRATRYHHARRKLKEAAASVVEAVYMRSPMYQRLKQKDTFKGYQAIVMTEKAAGYEHPGSGGARKFGLGRLSPEEMESLHACLDDGIVMDTLRRFRKVKEEVAYRRSVQEADESYQVTKLSEINARTERHVDALQNVLAQIAELAKTEPAERVR